MNHQVNLKKGAGIQSLQVGFSVVDLLSRNGQPMSFTDIYNQVSITKSNLYKYLNTLTFLGVLHKEKTSGFYTLGSKLIEYGMSAVNQEDIVERVTPYLLEINRVCQSTAIFSTWTNEGPMIVRIINHTHGMNIGAQVGTYLPIMSSSGQIFYSFMPQGYIQEWTEQELNKISKKEHQLLEEKRTIIQSVKIAFAQEPLIESVSSVAVPVFNYLNKLMGAIVLVGFSEAIPQDIHHEHSKFLLKVSQQVSQSLGAH